MFHVALWKVCCGSIAGIAGGSGSWSAIGPNMFQHFFGIQRNDMEVLGKPTSWNRIPMDFQQLNPHLDNDRITSSFLIRGSGLLQMIRSEKFHWEKREITLSKRRISWGNRRSPIVNIKGPCFFFFTATSCLGHSEVPLCSAAVLAYQNPRRMWVWVKLITQNVCSMPVNSRQLETITRCMGPLVQQFWSIPTFGSPHFLGRGRQKMEIYKMGFSRKGVCISYGFFNWETNTKKCGILFVEWVQPTIHIPKCTIFQFCSLVIDGHCMPLCSLENLGI